MGGYFVTDIESVPDNDLILQTNGGILGTETREEALIRIKATLCQGKDAEDCFIPPRYHQPVCIVLTLLDPQLQYMGHKTLTHTDLTKPGHIVHEFWREYNEVKQHYQPTLVTFNGRGFDMKVMEALGLAYGTDLTQWLKLSCPPWEDPRHILCRNGHIDLFDTLGKHGSLGFWAHQVGAPGKVGVDGTDVEALFEAGRLDTISAYCATDVLNTIAVLGRVLYCTGVLPRDWRNEAFEQVMGKMMEGRETDPIMTEFLSRYRSEGMF
jgi:predicted PolB exonuclease-like 3'-5' exonuclease